MFEDPGDLSLVEILDARHDTGFDGRRPSEMPGDLRSPPGETMYTDSLGHEFSHPHDHIATKTVDGSPAGILVADENGQNCFEHSYDDLPHLIGLFVREEYQGDGIASVLVHEFMATVDEDTCVVDCERDVRPFYEQLDCDIIYGEKLKRGGDPTEPPSVSQ